MWKKVALLAVLLAGAIPFYYGSTDLNYLQFRILHSIFTIQYKFSEDFNRPNISAEYRAFEKLFLLSPIARYDLTKDPIEVAEQMRNSFKLNSLVRRPNSCRVKADVIQFEGKTTKIFFVDHRQQIDDSISERILLYFHGGGYVLGDIDNYAGFECFLSKMLNMTIVHLEYRRAPEHPLPAAVDDALTLYRSFLSNGISSSRLIIMGDSAGGGLTLLTLQKIIELQLEKPRAAITLSPWADLSLSSESYTRNRLTDVMLKFDSILWLIPNVLGSKQHESLAKDSAHSPMFGSFEGFPPLLINFGTAELLEDEARYVVEKAKKQGVDVTMIEGEHLLHVYPIFFEYFPEGQKTLFAIRQWIDERFRS